MTYWFGGTLWKMKTDGTEATEVLSDTFCALAISANGQKLALATKTEETGGKLVIFDLVGLTLDTILTSHSDIFDVVFSKTDPQKIYYCSKNYGVYRINIDGSGEELINPSIRNYFDLTSSDSIITRMPYYHPKPRVHPSLPYIAYIKPKPVAGAYAKTDDIILVNMETMDTTYLNANPYKYSWIFFPYWFPDGNKLIFTAYEFVGGDPLRLRPGGEIWLLEKVFNK